MLRRLREQGPAYLVVGPFAIVLAFPFYWMFMTALKVEGDLYNPANVPFKFNDVSGPAADSPTTENVEFLFDNTKYLEWLENTLVVGAIVVVITLSRSLPARYALARHSGS